MELVLRGYPSSLRFAEWQQANSLPADKLPHLNEGQKARARDLRISERGYAISLKAAELARQRADAKMDRVARVIAESDRGIRKQRSLRWSGISGRENSSS